MRLLGIDFGLKRIGIAVGETEVGIATAHKSLAASGSLSMDASAIAGLAEKNAANEIVLGTPLNDQDPRMSRICEKLAERLRDLGLRVNLIDESLTTIEAERTLRSDGLSVKHVKDLKDGEAARILLLRYMEVNGAKKG